MYSSLLSGRNGIYGIHAMGKNVTANPTRVNARLRVFLVGWALTDKFTSAVLERYLLPEVKVYWVDSPIPRQNVTGTAACVSVGHLTLKPTAAVAVKCALSTKSFW